MPSSVRQAALMPVGIQDPQEVLGPGGAHVSLSTRRRGSWTGQHTCLYMAHALCISVPRMQCHAAECQQDGLARLPTCPQLCARTGPHSFTNVVVQADPAPPLCPQGPPLSSAGLPRVSPGWGLPAPQACGAPPAGLTLLGIALSTYAARPRCEFLSLRLTSGPCLPSLSSRTELLPITKLGHRGVGF